MKRLATIRTVRLSLEKLEDRLQPSLGLFGDPLDNIFGQPAHRKESVHDLALLAGSGEEAARAEQPAAAAPKTMTVTPATTTAAPIGESATLQAVVNSGSHGGAAGQGTYVNGKYTGHHQGAPFAREERVSGAIETVDPGAWRQ